MVRYYCQMRQQDQTEQKAYRTTVRQLESIIRLSEALARVHLDPIVNENYVREAHRLLKSSIVSVHTPDINLQPDLEEQENKEQEQGVANGKTKNVFSPFFCLCFCVCVCVLGYSFLWHSIENKKTKKNESNFFFNKYSAIFMFFFVVTLCKKKKYMI